MGWRHSGERGLWCSVEINLYFYCHLKQYYVAVLDWKQNSRKFQMLYKRFPALLHIEIHFSLSDQRVFDQHIGLATSHTKTNSNSAGEVFFWMGEQLLKLILLRGKHTNVPYEIHKTTIKLFYNKTGFESDNFYCTCCWQFVFIQRCWGLE